MKDKNDFRYLIPIGTGLLAWSVALRLFATAKTLTMILYIGLFILGVVCIVDFYIDFAIKNDNIGSYFSTSLLSILKAKFSGHAPESQHTNGKVRIKPDILRQFCGKRSHADHV